MAQVEKHYFKHQLFKSRNADSDPLIPVSPTTGARMIAVAVEQGIIPPPSRIAGREILPESSVLKLQEFIHGGGFAELRVNPKKKGNEKLSA